MKKDNILQNNACCSTLFLSLMIVSGLYFTSIIKRMPCGGNLTDRFYSNFVHTDFIHLIKNLYVLYSLSRVEKDLGSKTFTKLIVFLLISNTVIESIFRKIFPRITCSVGFSGILIGVTIFDLFNEDDKYDKGLLTSVVIEFFYPILKDNKVSMSGHITGMISGFISSIIWLKLYKKKI